MWIMIIGNNYENHINFQFDFEFLLCFSIILCYHERVL